MPYIKSDNDRREKLRNREPALNAGELNYQIFYYVKHAEKIEEAIIKGFTDQFLGENPNYQRFNDLTGALVRCGIEIKRRLGIEAVVLCDVLLSYNDRIDSYEDLKITENGDVE